MRLTMRCPVPLLRSRTIHCLKPTIWGFQKGSNKAKKRKKKVVEYLKEYFQKQEKRLKEVEVREREGGEGNKDKSRWISLLVSSESWWRSIYSVFICGLNP